MAKSNPSAAVVDDLNMDDSSSSNADVVEDADDNGSDAGDDSVYGWVWISICGYLITRIIYYSYRIRMTAIDEYGPVIHEFDPYFNYRATEVRKEEWTIERTNERTNERTDN